MAKCSVFQEHELFFCSYTIISADKLTADGASVTITSTTDIGRVLAGDGG